ncbi:MAG: DNA-binding response regulator [Chloroflexi bacterium HGW-Chloroflexi-5]|jgi:DNA-binding response OmpR family regulator|nr:MAG: DNA-binding response regulator [Chloroflexi bacterium HGW-Chloroflexi-5]
MKNSILVVEDEKALRETLEYNLTNEGYEVDTSADGLDAYKKAHEGNYNLILLDIMLPGMDGFEICRKIRAEKNTPILMLTARDDEIDRIVGLEVGADDYMSKPFSMRELLARVKAMLRRVRLMQEESTPVPVETISKEVLSFGDLIIDSIRREVRINNVNLELKPKEFELLHYLAINRGRALSRDKILEDVWGWDYMGESRTVDVHMRWLRQKIEVDPGQPNRLVTVRGAGYRFEG